MKTLLLDQTAWDLVLDAQGNIAVAENPYAVAQDVASAIRAFRGEVYYDTAQGVPYFTQLLGRYPPAQVIKAAFVAAAETVPEVVSAQCYLQVLDSSRQLVGQVQATTTSGQTLVVTSPTSPGQPGQLNFSDPQQSAWISI